MITKEEIYKVIPKKILIEVIESFYLQLFNGVHGIDHWTRVLQNGIILCDKNPNLNKNIIIAFSFFHDVGRTREDDEPIHGYNGGRRLLKYKYKINLTSDSLYQIERNNILISQDVTEKEFTRTIKFYLDNLDEFELLLKDVKLELEKINLH